jgi:hypothetical protein
LSFVMVVCHLGHRTSDQGQMTNDTYFNKYFAI